MINKIITFLFAVTVSAQSIAALDSPFTKTSRVDIGPVSSEKKPVKKSIEKFLSKPINSIKSMRSMATPALKPKAKTARLCFIKPPAKFNSIKPVKYICGNNVAKGSARTIMAASVKAAREQKARLAEKWLQKSKQYLAKQQALEEEKRREAEVISITDQNTNKIHNEVSGKMIGMCKKKWAAGEHRCYCEPYLAFAPAGITSIASCVDG